MALGSTISQITKSGLHPGIEFPSLVVSGIVTATTVKVGSAISVTDGAVSATRYFGDGSALTGVVQSDTPIGNSTASTTFYEIDDNVAITTTTTLSRSSSNPGVIYTKFQSISVGSAPGTVELIVPDGEELVVDAYQLAINTKDI